jgi:mono/diheme cytochrome c family protein
MSPTGRRKIVYLGVLLSAAFLVCSAHQARAQDTDAGLALAKKNCARCHAIGKTGESPNSEAPPFREIVSRYPVETLAEAFAEGITVGHEAMPEFSFAPEEIEDLLAYISSLNP